MRLCEWHWPNDAVGLLFRALRVMRGQVSKIRFSGFDAEVKLLGKETVLHPQQAVNNPVELIFTLKKMSFSFVAVVAIAVGSKPSGREISSRGRPAGGLDSQ